MAELSFPSSRRLRGHIPSVRALSVRFTLRTQPRSATKVSRRVCNTGQQAALELARVTLALLVFFECALPRQQLCEHVLLSVPMVSLEAIYSTDRERWPTNHVTRHHGTPWSDSAHSSSTRRSTPRNGRPSELSKEKVEHRIRSASITCRNVQTF